MRQAIFADFLKERLYLDLVQAAGPVHEDAHRDQLADGCQEAPILPYLNRGMNTVSSFWDVTSAKNWLNKAFGYSHFFTTCLPIRPTGLSNNDIWDSVSISLNIALNLLFIYKLMNYGNSSCSGNKFAGTSVSAPRQEVNA